MSSVASNAAGFDRKEPLPGYKVVELLGRGGSGEVWRAIAPGGLAKAVKIVYGDADPAQAATEMRSLSRMKDVRHPLLLSIERIETVCGNLVIVTELADCSLKQYFNKCREAGSPGVPQAELVRHLDDVAQVLDFLYEKYSLQHLDVKPENILLVSGRAKVGDFGLVKNLYERSASLIGGLTPTYAPPELFEGKPTRHSDQYSLALVYMQMLTGVSPFTANNMAQLAAQHMRAAPDLSALPKRQRPVIARALSKDPAQRFETCVAMVEALRDSIRETDRGTDSRAVQHTESTAGETVLQKAPVIHPSVPRSVCEAPTARREPAAVEPRKASVRGDAAASSQGPVTRPDTQSPVVFVGLGSAGVEVLAKLVNRLRDRFGRVDCWPAVEMLAIDSNTKTLTSQFREEDLPRIQVVPIPLKSAESYGAQADHYVRWLGRRWFYNIPRDLTTGGFRPLGRLALLTHATRVREAIASVVSRAGAAPRVIVVGSISGGTGGGALLDFTYALRGELKRRGYSDDAVHGILMHATPRGNADRDKARADAYATLCELHHFSRPGGNYPGEPALQAPPFHGDNATFGRLHLLNLGNGLGAADWELATDQVSEFVYCTSFTAARRILDGNAGEEGAWPACVQPYDVLAMGAGSSRLVDQWTRIASNDVIQILRKGREAALKASMTGQDSSRTLTINVASKLSAAKSEELAPEAARCLSEARLQPDDLLVDAAEVLDLEVESGEKFVERLADESLDATRSQTEIPARVNAILRTIDEILESEAAGNVDDSQDLLYGRIVSRLIVRTHASVDSFLSGIKRLLDAPALRIEGARQMCEATQNALQSSQDRLLVQAGELRQAAVELGDAARDPEAMKEEKPGLVKWALGRSNPEQKLRDVLKQYATTRLNELLARVAAKILRIVHAELSSVIENLNRLCRDLSLLAEPIQPSEENADAEPATGAAAALAGFRRLVLVELERGRVETARKTEDALERRLAERRLGLQQLLDPCTELRREIGLPLAEVARQEVLKRVREISCQLIAATPQGNAADGDLVSLLAAATRASATPAGEILGRVLVLPEEANTSHVPLRVRAALPDTLVVHDKRCDVTLCSIRQPATLSQVAHEVIAGNEQYKELAARLHTRNDIRWSPLTADEPAQRESEPAGVEEAPEKTVALRV